MVVGRHLDGAVDRPREGTRHLGAGADGAHHTVSYVVGKTIPYLAISFVTSLGILLLAMLLFGLPMQGIVAAAAAGRS